MATQSSALSTASNKLLRAQMITRQARMIFSAYRKDDFADPDNFVLQVGLVLERYPDAVISEVSGPLTGIQRRCKFPPSIAELVEACDEEVARRERIRRLGELKTVPRAPRPIGVHRANVFVPADSPCYPAMLERARNADPLDWRRSAERAGIWVAMTWLDDKTEGKTWRRLTGDELRAMYPESKPEAPAA